PNVAGGGNHVGLEQAEDRAEDNGIECENRQQRQRGQQEEVCDERGPPPRTTRSAWVQGVFHGHRSSAVIANRTGLARPPALVSSIDSTGISGDGFLQRSS